jgi:hypothetical protein
MADVTASAIDHIGLTRLANRFGYRPSAVQKWRDQGRLPQSELAGLTQYAEAIEELSDGKYTAVQLIAETRLKWTANPPKKSGPKRKRIRRAA